MQMAYESTTDGMLDYLATIYRLSGGSDGAANKITTTRVAEKMQVSAAAVSSMLKRLETLGFVQRSGVDGVKLEPQGRLAALQLIRRHRLLEVFLMQIMKFSWDQVDAESHRLEHAISMGFVDRMDELCGFPTHCPHGDPIPTKEGYMPHEELVPLNALQPDQGGYLWRIATDDAHILRYLGQRKLIPGQKITVIDIAPFKGPITIQVGDRAEASDAAGDATQVFGVELATLLYVTLDKTPEDMRSGWRS